MSYSSYTKCDNPKCINQVDNANALSPTYHKLIIGGSDFEMSFNGDRELDFCCIECLKEFLKGGKGK